MCGKNLRRKEETPMRYEKPEVQVVGDADELIQVIFTDNPLDLEVSTSRDRYIDPQFASAE